MAERTGKTHDELDARRPDDHPSSSSSAASEPAVADETVPLAYTEWTLVELAGAPVDLPAGGRPPCLALDLEESRVTGSGGVNRIMGTFALAENELRFGPLATTMIAGSDEALARERAFLDTLATVTSYRLESASLTLLADDEAVARLEC